LVDNNSWVLPYAAKLVLRLNDQGYSANLVRNAAEVGSGWINLMLGCTHVVSSNILSRNQYNLVVHASDLPHGRGFSPMTWQILEGKKNIPICLISASEEVDAGDILIRDVIELRGDELCDEWRAILGCKTLEICMRFVEEHKNITPIKQVGASSWYKRRNQKDSSLDVDKTIREQFQLLRVVDNEKYPAYFEMNGCVYRLRISKH